MATEEISLQDYYSQSDRIMLGLLWGLFLYSLLLAGWYDTWSEAFVIGLPAALVPTGLYFIAKGTQITRSAVAAAFMIFSALSIHQGHGMIELHFIIFVLLAFLLQYKDWIPVLVGAAVIAVHHLGFNFMQEWGFGVYLFPNRTGIDLVLIHAAFVVFETAVLIYLNVKGGKELKLSIETQQIGSHLAVKDGMIDLSYRQENPSSQFAFDFNDFMQHTHKTLIEVLGASAQLTSSTDEMTDITSRNKVTMNDQQGQIEQVATAINQMTATVQEVAQNTSAAADAAINADDEAAKGHNIVNQMMSSISSLEGTVSNASQVVADLEKDSQNIGTVLDVIKSIAEQTNLLALNAAIEAARAGEQGRGFAVVADEVRTLASRTQQSTSEIEEMITRLQSGSQNAVQAMEEGRQQTTKTVELTSEVSQSLNGIVQSVGVIKNMNQQVATAGEEQNAVANEINQSISQISHGAQTSSEAADITDNASSVLANLGQQLQEQTRYFKV